MAHAIMGGSGNDALTRALAPTLLGGGGGAAILPMTNVHTTYRRTGNICMCGGRPSVTKSGGFFFVIAVISSPGYLERDPRSAAEVDAEKALFSEEASPERQMSSVAFGSDRTRVIRRDRERVFAAATA